MMEIIPKYLFVRDKLILVKEIDSIIPKNILNYYKELSDYGVNIYLSINGNMYDVNEVINAKLIEVNSYMIQKQYLQYDSYYIVNFNIDNIVNAGEIKYHFINTESKKYRKLTKYHNERYTVLYNELIKKYDKVIDIGAELNLPSEVRFNNSVTALYLRTLPDLYIEDINVFYEIKILKDKKVYLEFIQLLFNLLLEKHFNNIYYMFDLDILYKPSELLQMCDKTIYIPLYKDIDKTMYFHISNVIDMFVNSNNFDTKIIIRKDISNYSTDPYVKVLFE